MVRMADSLILPLMYVISSHPPLRPPLSIADNGRLFAWRTHLEGRPGNTTIDTQSSRHNRYAKKLHSKSKNPCAAQDTCFVAVSHDDVGYCATITTGGRVYMWGSFPTRPAALSPRKPVLVPGLTGHKIISVACGEYSTAAVSDTGALFTWGINRMGCLGHGDSVPFGGVVHEPRVVDAFRGQAVVSVACAAENAYMVAATARPDGVYAWGRNPNGALCLDDEAPEAVTTPRRIAFFDGRPVRSVHTSYYTFGAVLESGELYMWGDDEFGLVRPNMSPADYAVAHGGVTIRQPVPVAGLAGKRVLDVCLYIDSAIALVR